MLRSLTADTPSFVDVTFRPGMNVLVAERGAGGSGAEGPGAVEPGPDGPALADVLHFLLGGSGTPRVPRAATFRLEAEWPTADQHTRAVTVRRSGADAGHIFVDPDPRDQETAGALFPVGTEAALSPEEWTACVERDLFRIPPDAPWLSGRTLLSYVLRREPARAFDDPARVSPQQPPSDATAHLAHLLGLDGQLAGELHALALREQTGRQARKAAEDPALRRLFGDTGELRGRIRRVEEEAALLRKQIAEFRVGPASEALRERAEELNRRLRTLPDEEVVDRRTLHDLERALGIPEGSTQSATRGTTQATTRGTTTDAEAEAGAEAETGTGTGTGTDNETGAHSDAAAASDDAAAAADDAAVLAVYEQAGLVLGPQVRRDFEDVRAFHRSLVRNRRHHLRAELAEVRARIGERAEDRASVADELAAVLRELAESGALEALTAVRRALAGREALLETLRHRYEAARALESSARRLRGERARLLDTAAADLDERRAELAEAQRVFAACADRLCGPGTAARLTVEAGPTDLTVTPHFSGPVPPALATLCLDLTLATLARRHARGPGLLVHGAHLLTGLEAPQLAAALSLASEICANEGCQYVAVLDPDALKSARGEGYAPDPGTVRSG